MRPVTAIFGVIAGSLISMAFSLAVTLFVFFMLRHDNPRFAVELPELVRGAAMFVVLAVLSAIGFLGTVRQARWRHLPLTLTWIGIVMVGWYYWPV